VEKRDPILFFDVTQIAHFYLPFKIIIACLKIKRAAHAVYYMLPPNRADGPLAQLSPAAVFYSERRRSLTGRGTLPARRCSIHPGAVAVKHGTKTRLPFWVFQKNFQIQKNFCRKGLTSNKNKL
jgi:hypothetical protein